MMTATMELESPGDALACWQAWEESRPLDHEQRNIVAWCVDHCLWCTTPSQCGTEGCDRAAADEEDWS